MPDLRLAGDGGGGADFLLTEGVDDGGFACVGVADEADGDLFAVGVEGGELAEEGNEGAFAEGVGQACMEGEGWVFLGEQLNPFCLCRGLHVSISAVLDIECRYTVERRRYN